jgi:hypothetical protein
MDPWNLNRVVPAEGVDWSHPIFASTAPLRHV